MSRTDFPEFLSAPRRTPSLYVLETSDGLVKVGMSEAPRQRLLQHGRDLKRRGIRILRHAVSPVTGRLYETERELLKRMGRHATCRPETLEWFQDIAYGAALTLVRQMTRRQFVDLWH